MKRFTEPMTEEERQENVGEILKRPTHYHLIDCLKDLKFGRTEEEQKQLQNFINELEK